MNSIVKITKSAYETLLALSRFPPEVGAVIGGTSDTISHVWFDVRAGIGNAVYQPTAIDVETTVACWRKSNINFQGFIHSHHSIASPSLSSRDIFSAQRIMKTNKLTHLFLGVLLREQVFMYCVYNTEGGAPTVEQLKAVII